MNLNIIGHNSSTIDAAIGFAKGESLTKFESKCWPKCCKKLIRKQQGKVKIFRSICRRWLTKEGWDWKN